VRQQNQGNRLKFNFEVQSIFYFFSKY